MDTATGNASIFIVHTDENAVRGIRDMLTAAGHYVAVVTNARSAQELIPKSPPDIVITSPSVKLSRNVALHAWLREQHEVDSETLLLVEKGEIPEAISLVESGVIYDYFLINPLLDLLHLRLIVHKVLELRELRHGLISFQREISRLHDEEIPEVLREQSAHLTTGISGDLLRIEASMNGEDEVIELSANARKVLAELGTYRQTGLAGRVEESSQVTRGNLKRYLSELETNFADRLVTNAPAALGTSPAFRSQSGYAAGELSAAFANALTLVPNPENDQMLRGILSSCGLKVYRASSIDGVLELIKQRKMDLVIVDIDSFLDEWRDYVSRFRAFTSTRDGVLMVMTSQPTPELIQVLAQQRVDHILALPTAPEVLYNKVQQALAERFRRATTPLNATAPVLPARAYR